MTEETHEAYFNEDKTTSVRNQYFAAVIVSIGTFCYGSDIGWVSPSLEYLQGPSAPLETPLTAKQTASVASLYCIGAIAGTYTFGLLAQRFGRKNAGLAVAVPYTLCWILKLTVKTIDGLYAARVLSGIGGGGALLIAPLYCLEIGSNKVRGALGSITVLALNAGVLFAYTIGALFSYTPVLWIHLAIPLVYFLGLVFMPETPTYLVKAKKYEEAAKAIAWLRCIPSDHPTAQGILSNLKQEALLASKDSNASNDINNTISLSDITNSREQIAPDDKKPEDVPGWKLFYKSRATIKAFVVCFVLINIQGYVGVFAIVSFASDIFMQSGTSISPVVAAIIMSVLQLIGSCASIYLVEKMGRKILFAISSSMLGMCLIILGTYLHFKELGYDVSLVNWIPIATLSIGICVDAIGVGPVPFVIVNEVFMIQARGIAVTFLISLIWVTEFIQTEFYVVTVEAIGIDGIFWAFASVALLGAAFCLLAVPETKGKPLHEILQFFDPRLETVREVSVTGNGVVVPSELTRF